MKAWFIFSLLIPNILLAIVPENNLSIPLSSLRSRGIEAQDFNQVIKTIEKYYRSEGIDVYRFWEDGTVNAYAENVIGSKSVNFFGGFARYPMMTKDAFAIVVCHEFGHHLGGAPKQSGSISFWASAEGQADYFATAKCLKRYLAETPNPEELSPDLFPDCQADQSCLRGVVASERLAQVFAQLESDYLQVPVTAPLISTPSQEIVSKTIFDDYPSHQCRLDTYIAGLLCQKDPEAPVSDIFPQKGYCAQANGDDIGLRPNCWYQPHQY